MAKKITVVDVLKMGATITFPSGYYFTGLPSDYYIELGHPYGKDGLVILNKEGLKEAYKLKKKWEEDNE